jgi:hypothetical protein
MIMMPYRSPRSSPQLTGLGRLLAPHRLMAPVNATTEEMKDPAEPPFPHGARHAPGQQERSAQVHRQPPKRWAWWTCWSAMPD